MRIILITSSSTKSGGSRQALYLAQGLSQAGHDVTFFTPAHSTLRQLDPAAPFWGDLAEKRRHWRASIERALPTDGRPFIVHAFHNAAVKRAAWWGLFWHRRNAVLVAHRGVIFRPNNPLPYWSPGIDHFAVNSEACAKVLRTIGVGKERVSVVHNAIPDARLQTSCTREEQRKIWNFTPHAPQEASNASPLIFGAIAGNNPVKGVDILLRAYAAARKETGFPPSGLVITGVSTDAWQKLCIELDILDAVRLIPHTENIANILQALDVFVLPSRSESMPNTLLEAIRMGLPAIGSNVGGVAEILTPCGLLVPAEDIPALAQAMTKLATDPQLRSSLASKAQEQAQRYSPQHRIKAVLRIYKKLLKKRHLATE